MESENLYLVTITIIADSVITDSIRNYLWELKRVYTNWMNNWISSFTVFPRRDLLRCIRHHRKQVFKGNITNNGTSPRCEDTSFLGNPTKTVGPTSNPKEISEKAKFRHIP